MNYEAIRDLIAELRKPSSDDARSVEWIDEDSRLGVARDAAGRIELFVGSNLLRSRSPIVRSRMEYDKWRSERGIGFSANRLLLSENPHHLPTAAFLVRELLNNGFAQQPREAFEDAEPLIEMVLRQGRMGDPSALGLLGELMFLHQLFCSVDTKAQLAEVVGAWKGSDRSARDFRFPQGIGVEVKTTSRSESTHTAHSLAQVNPERGQGGVPTETLYWLSIGLEDPLPEEEDRVSVRSVFEKILSEVRRVAGKQSAIEHALTNKVTRYGVGEAVFFDPRGEPVPEVFTVEYAVNFMRLYDMAPEGVQVVRPVDVKDRIHTVASSIAFDVRLPERIGVGNPRTDVAAMCEEVVNGL